MIEENTCKTILRNYGLIIIFLAVVVILGNHSTTFRKPCEPAERRQTGVRERHSGVWK